MTFQKFLPFIKHTLLVSVFLLFVGLSGCDDDETSGPTVFSGTVMAMIDTDAYKQAKGAPATEALDSLVKYLKFYQLENVVNTTPQLTLFAPSNQAFVNLLTTTPGFPSRITDISPSIVTGVLAYHVHGAKKMKSDLTSGTTLATLFSQPNNCNPQAAGTVQNITVNANGTLLTGSTNNEIDVVKADLQATNGVAHIVESVMIPPSIGNSLTPILTTVAAPALLSSNFSIVAGLITFADCGVAAGQTPLVNILANPAGNYTVFFPPNAVFQQAGAGTTVQSVLAFLASRGVTTPAQVRGILLGHVITADEYTRAELLAAAPVTYQAANGANIQVTKNANNQVILNGTIPVLVGDADNRNNGMVHVIGGVIGL